MRSIASAGRRVSKRVLRAACSASMISMLIGLFAAYAFACWSFRGQRLLFLLVVATWLVPFQVTELPNYVLLSHLGLLNTLAGVIVPQLASAFSVRCCANT